MSRDANQDRLLDVDDNERRRHAMTESGLRLSVIVPAFQCAEIIGSTLAGLTASDLPRESWELIVVDDGSRDSTADVARAVADRVVVLTGGPHGPARARNRGALEARASILLFVDADVVVAPHTLSGFLRCFDAHPEVAAVFGAYDDRPRAAGLVSQYRNLLHHYVHRCNPGEALTFWAGCGAVRRDAFLAVGGYDDRRYPRPQIEDIEFGYRLSAHGYRIWLSPDLQGTHLKRWTLRNMIRTDFRERAVPWMRLLLERGESTGHGPLNVHTREKLLTALCGLGVLALSFGLWQGDRRWIAASVIPVVAIALTNFAMLRWYASVRGWLFAVRVLPLRVLFYLTGGFGALWAIISYPWRPRFPARLPLHISGDGSHAI